MVSLIIILPLEISFPLTIDLPSHKYFLLSKSNEMNSCIHPPVISFSLSLQLRKIGFANPTLNKSWWSQWLHGSMHLMVATFRGGVGELLMAVYLWVVHVSIYRKYYTCISMGNPYIHIPLAQIPPPHPPQRLGGGVGPLGWGGGGI